MTRSISWLPFRILVLCITATAFFLAGCTQSNVQSQTNQHQTQGLLYCAFDVSPDGKTIVFSGAGNGGKDLYLLDLTTSKVTRLTDTPEYENYPTFSPDGKSIVYQSAKTLELPRYLFLRSVDGKYKHQLTHDTYTSDSNPSFSWDGGDIVFCRSHTFYGQANGENTWDDQDVYTVGRDGNTLTRLTTKNYKGMITPRFYLDKKFILFDTTEFINNNVQSSLVRISTTGGPIQQVVRQGSLDGCPSFFPDGKQIVFTINTGGNVDLYKIRLDSGVAMPLIPGHTGTGFTLPRVTRDGTHIFCLRGYEMSLWEMNADGTGLHQIADSSLFSDPMHWKPTAK